MKGAAAAHSMSQITALPMEEAAATYSVSQIAAPFVEEVAAATSGVSQIVKGTATITTLSASFVPALRIQFAEKTQIPTRAVISEPVYDSTGCIMRTNFSPLPSHTASGSIMSVRNSIAGILAFLLRVQSLPACSIQVASTSTSMRDPTLHVQGGMVSLLTKDAAPDNQRVKTSVVKGLCVSSKATDVFHMISPVGLLPTSPTVMLPVSRKVCILRQSLPTASLITMSSIFSQLSMQTIYQLSISLEAFPGEVPGMALLRSSSLPRACTPIESPQDAGDLAPYLARTSRLLLHPSLWRFLPNDNTMVKRHKPCLLFM